jgi:hypothetical protein
MDASMTLKTTIAVLGLALALGGCATTGTAGRLPSRIVIERGGFIPEGIEFDTTSRRFLSGSLVDGTIYIIGADGHLTPFVLDRRILSSVGIEADEPRDRLLVAVANRAVFDGSGPGIAMLGVYRLATGASIAMVDLGAVAGGDADSIVFANDLAVAPDGNVYITDTWMNLIYRVDTSYKASVLYRFEPRTGLGLNGIVYSDTGDAGFLIVVAIGGQGLLYKVPIDNPKAAHPIDLSQPAIGADGLVFAPDGRLIVVSNSTSSVLAYTSDDDWESGTLAGTAKFEGQATTGAIVDDDVYVVEPHFDDADPPVLQRVHLGR